MPNMCESFSDLKADSSKLSDTDLWALPLDCKHPYEEGRDLMSSYIAGTCSPIVKQRLETHYLFCARCRCILAIILRVVASPLCQGKEEKALISLGVEAARITRQGQKRKAHLSLKGDSCASVARQTQFS
jgi:hypothetical protein